VVFDGHPVGSATAAAVIVLPPNVVFCGFVALAAPYLLRRKDRITVWREAFIPDWNAVAHLCS
jgi:hypothetical protein